MFLGNLTFFFRDRQEMCQIVLYNGNVRLESGGDTWHRKK